jgi:hypothetical protein
MAESIRTSMAVVFPSEFADFVEVKARTETASKQHSTVVLNLLFRFKSLAP